MRSVLHSAPWITEADTTAVTAQLRSGMIAAGAVTARFERELADWVCADEPGVAVGSGTAALVLALRGLAVGAGDEVVLPSYVCTRVLRAVRATGATPICCDAGSHWVVTAATVAHAVTDRTRAVIVPHLYGIFADVADIRRLGVPVIEDCAQALADAGTRSVEGDVATFSFHATKCLTTGEGGMVVSPRRRLARAMRALRDGDVRFDGVISRMPDSAAALGLSQLARYPDALARRRTLARRYLAALSPCHGSVLDSWAARHTMFFRFPVRVAGGIDRYGVRFERRGIHVRRGVDRLLHRLQGRTDDRFPVSVHLFNTTVSLPIYPALDDRDHERCVVAAVDLLDRHSGVAAPHSAPLTRAS